MSKIVDSTRPDLIPRNGVLLSGPFIFEEGNTAVVEESDEGENGFNIYIESAKRAAHTLVAGIRSKLPSP